MNQIETHDRQVISEFRRTGGGVDGAYTGMKLLLLHHSGARSGIERVSPLLYWPVADDSVAVLASNLGAERNPGWYYNLIAHPRASVELGTAKWDVRAREASATERPALFERMAPTRGVREELEHTSRKVPVMILQRVGATDHDATPNRNG